MLTDVLIAAVDFTTLPVRPEAFTIPAFNLFGSEWGPLALRWYSLAYIIGIAGAWFLLTRMIRKPGAPLNQKVWIWQMVGDRRNFLESLSGDDECKTPADWAARLKAKQYAYGAHFLPHDACAENGGLWQGGLATAGLTGVVPVPRQLSVWDGINLAADAFPRIHFNADGCAHGLDALDAYHSKEERDGVTIKDVPVHDWSSHFADAFSLSHQAINRGMVIDRSAIPRKAVSGERPKVMAGFRGGFSRVRR